MFLFVEWRVLVVTCLMRIMFFMFSSSLFSLMYDHEELVCAMKCCGFLVFIIGMFVYNELVYAMIFEFDIQLTYLDEERLQYMTIKSLPNVKNTHC